MGQKTTWIVAGAVGLFLLVDGLLLAGGWVAWHMLAKPQSGLMNDNETHIHQDIEQIKQGARNNQQDSTEVLYKTAVDLVDNWHGDSQKLLKGIRMCEAILQENPRYTKAYVPMARAIYRLGYVNGDNYEPQSLADAMKVIDRALEVDPKFYEAHLTKAKILCYQHLLHDAQAELQEMKTLEPHNPRNHLLAAKIFYTQNDYPHTIEEANQALSMSLTALEQIEAYSFLSDAYTGLKQFDKSEPVLIKLIELEPSNAWAKGNYSQFLWSRKKDYDNAIHWGEAALKQMDYPWGRRNLADAYYAKGVDLYWHQKQAAQAVDYFNKAVALNPQHADAYYSLGICSRDLAYAQRNVALLEQAEKALETALKIDPKYPYAQHELDRTRQYKQQVRQHLGLGT